jgi:hypothetical protein
VLEADDDLVVGGGVQRWIAFLHGRHRAAPARDLLVAELRGLAAEPEVQALLRARVQRGWHHTSIPHPGLACLPAR